MSAPSEHSRVVTSSRVRRLPSWELLGIAAVLFCYLIANAVIHRSGTVMLRSAQAALDSSLQRDHWQLNQRLAQWRDGMLRDGRWMASVVGLMADARRGGAPAGQRFSDAELWQLREITLAQMPTARVWIVDARGNVLGGLNSDPLNDRHRWLVRMTQRGDTTLIAASEARENDLRLAVASPVRSGAGRGLTVVLDLSASARLRSRLQSPEWEGFPGRAALTFPFGDGFVSTTWTGDSAAPKIGWPKTGWSLTDSSLVVVAGAMPDTTTHVELGIPRAAATSVVAARTAWLYATAALGALLLSLMILLVGHVHRNRRLRDAERSLAESQLRTAQAEAAATRAGLAALQARLNPHFLSNALHSVAALIATDPDRAEEAVQRLGDLFRYSLEQSEKQLVRLEDEWAFVRDYLTIEQMRLGNRLTVEMDLDPLAEECDVPPFALQPLVENAIRHGIGPKREGGTVRVSAHRRGAFLDLIVSDNGAGAERTAVEQSAGTGLRTLQQRLALDPVCRGNVTVEAKPNVGFTVRVTLPAERSVKADQRFRPSRATSTIGMPIHTQ